MLYSDYQVHVMEHVPYVGFATYRRVTVRTRFTFCIYIYIKKRVVTARVLWGMYLQSLYFGYVIIIICFISFNQLNM